MSSTSPPGEEAPGSFLGRTAGWWRWAAVIACGALVFGLLAAVQGYYQATIFDRGPDFWRAVKVWMPDYLLWAALSPAVLALGRRWPLVGGRWVRHLALHVGLGLLFAAVELAASVWIVGHIVENLPPPNYDGYVGWYLGVLSTYAAWGLLLYFLILAGGQAHQLYQRFRDRQEEAARLDARALRLEARLSEARLSALIARLQPHFLFNTLNALAELIHRSPERAEQMVVRLGDLLRTVIRRSDEQWSTLADELDLVRSYLAIEEARYGDRLHTRIDVPDDLLDLWVPSLSLQPLVENAVRHGIAPLDDGGTVAVEAATEDGHLRLEVRDDGKGLSETGEEGIGLGTNRRRLDELFDGDFRLELESREGGGARATLVIPAVRSVEEVRPEPRAAAVAGSGAPVAGGER